MTTYKITIEGCTLQEYKTLTSLLSKYMGFDTESISVRVTLKGE